MFETLLGGVLTFKGPFSGEKLRSSSNLVKFTENQRNNKYISSNELEHWIILRIEKLAISWERVNGERCEKVKGYGGFRL